MATEGMTEVTIDYDDAVSGPGDEQASFDALCERRYSRRDFVKSGIALGATALTACSSSAVVDKVLKPSAAKGGISSFQFTEIPHGVGDNHLVAPDHESQLLIRWGDPLFVDAPEFDVKQQSVDSQKQQFGFNNDYVGYLKLPSEQGKDTRALLCVNHEYPSLGMMFEGFGKDIGAEVTAEQIGIAQAAVGNSIVEVSLRNNVWVVEKASPYNRRITAYDTPIKMSGPVAGHERVQTDADPSGTTVIGTLNNCAGGMTPWGTYLTCEENFNYHFRGKLEKAHPEASNHKRYNLKLDLFHWGKHDKRFDLAHEPKEPNRFGWVVEIDPLDPRSTPKKRTALGRFKHEGAENVLAPDGRLVVYMGDDQRFEYLYKFVSRDKVNVEEPAANRDLLDHGTLYVAKLSDEGAVQWLALSMDNPLLSKEFSSQAEILLESRRAADVLQATPMDRPEDVVPNKQNGKVYVILSNNKNRKKTGPANPRKGNKFGQIVEITEPDGDFASTTSSWDMLVVCGNPNDPEHQAQWNSATSENGWFASPDNGEIDPSGRLWVTTDQGPSQPLSGTNDGLWALETQGPLRGTGRMFFRVPNGAEMTGPAFSQDGESLFLAIQHPGDQLKLGGSRINNATTRWPDFEAGQPPRPSLVVVRRKTGGKVG